MAAATTFSLVAMAVGAAVSAYGAYSQGQAAKSAAQYQAAVAGNNKIMADRAAVDAQQRGEVAADKRREQAAQLIGRQRAVLAGNGVVVDQGSALDITSDTAATGEFEALTIRSNAEREAYQYRAQGENFSSEAQLATMRGDSAAQAGMFGAGSSILNGAGSVANKWYEYGKAGATT
jgi:hypothetical protein